MAVRPTATPMRAAPTASTRSVSGYTLVTSRTRTIHDATAALSRPRLKERSRAYTAHESSGRAGRDRGPGGDQAALAGQISRKGQPPQVTGSGAGSNSPWRMPAAADVSRARARSRRTGSGATAPIVLLVRKWSCTRAGSAPVSRLVGQRVQGELQRVARALPCASPIRHVARLVVGDDRAIRPLIDPVVAAAQAVAPERDAEGRLHGDGRGCAAGEAILPEAPEGGLSGREARLFVAPGEEPLGLPVLGERLQQGLLARGRPRRSLRW